MALYHTVEDIHHSARKITFYIIALLLRITFVFVTPQTITYLWLGFDDSNTKGRRRATNASYKSSTQLHSTRTRRNKINSIQTIFVYCFLGFHHSFYSWEINCSVYCNSSSISLMNIQENIIESLNKQLLLLISKNCYTEDRKFIYLYQS